MSRRGSGRGLAWFALLAVVFVVLTLPVFLATESTRAAGIVQGQSAGVDTDLAQGPIALAGEWRIQPLVMPGGKLTGDLGYVHVPGPWDGARLASGRRLGKAETVSYDLTLRGVSGGAYRLYVPPIWGASAVYVNGVKRSSRGTVGRDAATTRYRLQAHDVSFDTRGGDLVLRIDVSTYRDLNNGLRMAPVLGPAEAMHRWTSLFWARTFVVVLSFLIIGLFAFTVYASRPEDRSALFLALGSFSIMAVQSISFENLTIENLLLLAFPGLSHEGVYAALTIASFAALVFWVAYLDALFPDRRWHMVARGVIAAIIAGGAWQLGSMLIVGTIASSRTIAVFVISFALAAVFVGARSVHALIERREGAVLFMVGQMAILAALAIQVTVNVRLIAAPDFVSYGLLIFAFFHVLLIARRWTSSITVAETLNDDLSRLLEVNSAVSSEGHLVSLLERIAGVSTRILDAERSSIFVHDDRTSELWTIVAEGLECREIRLPDNAGVAGAVYQSGLPAHVNDAYADPRFNREIDETTGFHTRNLLCAPLIARDGRKLGVLQVINSRHGNDFTSRDLERLAAFSAQAAVAIDNAELFSAVLESRNYNERILSSMSSGVVTLQEEGRKARLNEAASRILGISREEAEASDAQNFIAAANPWLADEIAEVASAEGSKTFLDHDLVTVSNGTISANLSLVPLRDGERTSGVLVMIDDISSAKRLEGAIRRFMTQEVMDQVLAHDEDALFGSACTASVLFADIRGFTTLAEALSPRETVELLNELFGEMYEAVAGSDGVLDKFMGDAVMAVYGAPISTGRDAFNAVSSGIEMLRRLGLINARRAERGADPVRIGIGIATGEVVAGTIGSTKRMDYTVIGDSVNLASRLQDLTKTYGVELIVDEATAVAVARDGISLRELDVIQVRGRSQQTRVFEVLARAHLAA